MDPIKIKLEFTIDEVNIILLALQELPGKICNPMSAKIKGQVQPQLSSKTEVAPQE